MESKIYTKLANMQQELKAPKSQYNSFGGYKYRSCEDILESVKPLLKANKLSLQLYDELEFVGERYYIKATARLLDLEDNSTLENTAYAREEETKKGMDGSQITGTASSYARKYALNGLFLIDDTKDVDTDEYKKQNNNTKTKSKVATPNQVAVIKKNYTGDNLTKLLNKNKISTVEEMPYDKATDLIGKLLKAKEDKKKEVAND